MKEKQVIFTHGIPFDKYLGEGDGTEKIMKNTSGNNRIVDAKKLDYELLTKTILGLQPTISTCVNKVSETDPAAHYYHSGLLLGGGTIMMAQNSDMFTETRNIYSKGKKDGEKTTKDLLTHNIQGNIEENLNQAINSADNNQQGAKNEIIIENPDTLGIYIDYNAYQKDLNKEDDNSIKGVQKLSNKLNLPLFGLIDGKIRELTIDENGEVLEGKFITIEEIQKKHKEISIDNKLEYIDDSVNSGIFENSLYRNELEKNIYDREMENIWQEELKEGKGLDSDSEEFVQEYDLIRKKAEEKRGDFVEKFKEERGELPKEVENRIKELKEEKEIKKILEDLNKLPKYSK